MTTEIQTHELTMKLLANNKKTHLNIVNYWMLHIAGKQTDTPQLTCGFSHFSMLTVYAITHIIMNEFCLCGAVSRNTEQTQVGLQKRKKTHTICSADALTLFVMKFLNISQSTKLVLFWASISFHNWKTVIKTRT